MSILVRAGLVAVLFAAPTGATERDAHSFANPEHVRVRHIDLDLDVDFDARVIRGTAMLRVERTSKDAKRPLVLDTRGLSIDAVETSSDCRAFTSAAFELGKADPMLGRRGFDAEVVEEAVRSVLPPEGWD